jgi:hypothetical protein
MFRLVLEPQSINIKKYLNSAPDIFPSSTEGVRKIHKMSQKICFHPCHTGLHSFERHSRDSFKNVLKALNFVARVACRHFLVAWLFNIVKKKIVRLNISQCIYRIIDCLPISNRSFCAFQELNQQIIWRWTLKVLKIKNTKNWIKRAKFLNSLTS